MGICVVESVCFHWFLVGGVQPPGRLVPSPFRISLHMCQFWVFSPSSFWGSLPRGLRKPSSTVFFPVGNFSYHMNIVMCVRGFVGGKNVPSHWRSAGECRHLLV